MLRGDTTQVLLFRGGYSGQGGPNGARETSDLAVPNRYYEVLEFDKVDAQGTVVIRQGYAAQFIKPALLGGAPLTVYTYWKAKAAAAAGNAVFTLAWARSTFPPALEAGQSASYSRRTATIQSCSVRRVHPHRLQLLPCL